MPRAHTHTHTHTHAHTHAHIHTHINTHTHTHAHTHIYTCARGELFNNIKLCQREREREIRCFIE